MGNQHPWQKRWQKRRQSKLKLKFVHGRNYLFAPNHLETLMRPTTLYLHLQVTCPTWHSEKNKQGSDTQRNQIQSPVMWNPEHWTRSGHSQLKKPKLTGMRKGTNCFHRWRTLKKKTNPTTVLLLKMGLFYSPTPRRAGEDPGSVLSSLWRILSFVHGWTHLAHTYTAYLLLPGISSAYLGFGEVSCITSLIETSLYNLVKEQQ